MGSGRQVSDPDSGVYLIILGTVQDAGSPQLGCTKPCCTILLEKSDRPRMVTSLAVVDELSGSFYLFEASPDISRQLHFLSGETGISDLTPDGIFVSHAHIGHYTGLMYLGKEALNSDATPVYVMPRMHDFLKTNGPWSQLVELNNIKPVPIKPKDIIRFQNFSVEVFEVPHRDEYSETIGYKISGPGKTALFIPDIDKWEKWDRSIRAILRDVDYAFIDATFYDENEIQNRDISEIPHPFVVESMALFDGLDASDRSKINFIHFNHTNPLLLTNSVESNLVRSKGYEISFTGKRVQL